MLGDIMSNYDISKKTINTFGVPIRKNQLVLRNSNNKRRLINGNNLLNKMVGKYKAKEPMDCVELKHYFKKGVL